MRSVLNSRIKRLEARVYGMNGQTGEGKKKEEEDGGEKSHTDLSINGIRRGVLLG